MFERLLITLAQLKTSETHLKTYKWDKTNQIFFV